MKFYIIAHTHNEQGLLLKLDFLALDTVDENYLLLIFKQRGFDEK